MSPGDWTKFVHQEYEAFLQSKLPTDKLADYDAREEALQEQLEWFYGTYDSFIEQKKKAGRMGKSLVKILRPVISMVCLMLTILCTTA